MVKNFIKANNPTLKSWIEVNSLSDFPIQNLPFGIYSTLSKSKRVGVAIGTKILDLAVLFDLGYLDSLSFCEHCFSNQFLNRMMGHGKIEIRALRDRISELLVISNNDLSKNEEHIKLVFDNQSDSNMAGDEKDKGGKSTEISRTAKNRASNKFGSRVIAHRIRCCES